MNRNSVVKMGRSAALVFVTLLLCATPVLSMVLAFARAPMMV